MTDLPPVAPTLQPRSSGGRWMRVALALSLALNLGIAGVVGGTMLRAYDKPRPEPLRDLGFGPFTEALTPEDRAALRRAFVAAAPDLRAARREMRADLGAMLELLRAETFDAAGMRRLLAQQNARGDRMQALGQELLAERVGAMTPAARQQFADRLEQSLTRRRSNRSGPDAKP